MAVASGKAWLLNRLGERSTGEARQAGDFAETFSAPLPEGGVARVLRNVWRNSFRPGQSAQGEAFSEAGVTFGDQLLLTGISVENRGGVLEVNIAGDRCGPPIALNGASRMSSMSEAASPDTSTTRSWTAIRRRTAGWRAMRASSDAGSGRPLSSLAAGTG